MLILAILGYLLLGLLALALLLIAIALWSPVDFLGEGKVSVEFAGDPMALPGMWMAEEENEGPDELEVRADATVHGRVRFLWGAVQLSERGVRVLWWRPGGRRRGSGTEGDRGEEPSAPVQAHIRAKVKGQSLDVEVDAKTGTDDDGKGQAGREGTTGTRRRRSGTARFTIRDIRRLWPDVRRCLARSWRSLRLRLRVLMTVGLEDPATTGLLAGLAPAVVSPLIWSTNARRPGSITYRLTPVFDREVLAAEIELAGRATVYGITIAWIKLALRRDVRRLWWPSGRRKQKGGPKQ